MYKKVWVPVMETLEAILLKVMVVALRGGSPEAVRRWAMWKIYYWSDYGRYQGIRYGVAFEVQPHLAQILSYPVCERCNWIVWADEKHTRCDWQLGKIQVEPGLLHNCSACGADVPIGNYCGECGVPLALEVVLLFAFRDGKAWYVNDETKKAVVP